MKFVGAEAVLVRIDFVFESLVPRRLVFKAGVEVGQNRWLLGRLGTSRMDGGVAGKGVFGV